MKIYDKEIQFCLNRAREVSDLYRQKFIGGDETVRLVDRLLEICRDVLGKNISMYELDIDKSETPIWGACIMLEDRYDICRVKGLNPCWQRFVTCKEVFHVLIEKDEYRNVSLCAHVDEVSVVSPVSDKEYSYSVMAEQLAEIAAMEFMFPYRDRKIICDRGGDINTHAIAERYKVPLVFVERVLSPAYMGPLGKFND